MLLRFIILVLILSTGHLFAQAPKIHVVLVGDTLDYDLNAVKDLHAFQDFFTSVNKVTKSKVEAYWVTGAKYNRKALCQTIEGLPVQQNDAVFVVFPAHGSNIGGSYPAIVLPESEGSSKVMFKTETLYLMMQQLNCRLKALIVDACNNVVSDNSVEYILTSRQSESNQTSRNSVEKHIKQLFLKDKGSFLLVSSSKDQQAWGSQPYGGFFTTIFCNQFMPVLQAVDKPSWLEILENLRNITYKKSNTSDHTQIPSFEGNINKKTFSSADMQAPAIPGKIRQLLESKEYIGQQAYYTVLKYQEAINGFTENVATGNGEWYSGQRSFFAPLFSDGLSTLVAGDLPGQIYRNNGFLTLETYLKTIYDNRQKGKIDISFSHQFRPIFDFEALPLKPNYYSIGIVLKRTTKFLNNGGLLLDTTCVQQYKISFGYQKNRGSYDYKIMRILDHPEMSGVIVQWQRDTVYLDKRPEIEDLTDEAQHLMEQEAFAKVRSWSDKIEYVLRGGSIQKESLDSLFYPRSEEVNVEVSNLLKKRKTLYDVPKYLQKLRELVSKEVKVKWNVKMTDLTLLTPRPEVKLMGNVQIWESTIRFKQTFISYNAKGREGYKDITTKEITVIMFPNLNADGSVNHWEIRLGDTKVIETVPYNPANSSDPGELSIKKSSSKP